MPIVCGIPSMYPPKPALNPKVAKIQYSYHIYTNQCLQPSTLQQKMPTHNATSVSGLVFVCKSRLQSTWHLSDGYVAYR